jgi:tetratricopeptide (TPR) repeat protein/tRNA A-37 threonylcarbamoyl transferase component Bud32/TolB-like protein
MLGSVVAGRYRIVARIGAGGMGEVYEADDLELPRKVALKFLAPTLSDDRRLRQRFMREAEAISSLDHPHICTIYEAGETEDGLMYIAMAYYRGETLKKRLARGGLTLADAVAYGVAVADGMDKAHRNGILHRDLKPGNVVVTEDGVVKILDFGLAKLPDRTQMTRTGVAVGTLAYTSPEQARGQSLDVRSDVYSLGIVLYQMITGVSPFAADTAAATLQRVLGETPPPMRRIRSGIPERLESLIERSMSKDPDLRPSSMAEVRDELLEVLGELSPSRARRFHAARVEPGGRIRRRRLRIAVVVGALVAVAGLVAYRGALRSWLGAGGLPAGRGVAVLPLRMEGGGPASERLASGVWIDLSRRATRLSDLDPELWVLPARRVGDVSADEAAEVLGVDAVLTGVVRPNDETPKVELRLRDAASGRVVGSAAWSLFSDAVAPTRRLADLMGVDLEAPAAGNLETGYTHDPAAYRDFLEGLGSLPPASTADVDTALAALEIAVARDSSFVEARLGLAEALHRKGTVTGEPQWTSRATAICRAVVAIDSSSGAAHGLLGRIQSSAGDAQAAAEQLELAVTRRPRDPEYRTQLGWIRLQQGSYDAAEAIYRAAILANPRYFGAYEDLGYFYFVLGRNEAAIEEFQQASKLAPRYGRLYNYLGACLYTLERWDEATAMFEKSFALGRNYEACANLGTLYYMAGRFEDAARMYEWAREYDDTNHMVVGNLASALYWIPGRKDESTRRYEEAITLAESKRVESRREGSPEDPVLLAFLAGYYSVVDSSKAVTVAEEALRYGPDNSEVLFRVALVYEEVGQRTKALKTLGEAIEKGYPARVIAHERQLQDLREDPRYRLLLP